MRGVELHHQSLMWDQAQLVSRNLNLCRSGLSAKPHQDAQNRLHWQHQNRPAQTKLTMSSKA